MKVAGMEDNDAWEAKTLVATDNNGSEAISDESYENELRANFVMRPAKLPCRARRAPRRVHVNRGRPITVRKPTMSGTRAIVKDKADESEGELWTSVEEEDEDEEILDAEEIRSIQIERPPSDASTDAILEYADNSVRRASRYLAAVEHRKAPHPHPSVRPSSASVEQPIGTSGNYRPAPGRTGNRHNNKKRYIDRATQTDDRETSPPKRIKIAHRKHQKPTQATRGFELRSPSEGKKLVMLL